MTRFPHSSADSPATVWQASASLPGLLGLEGAREGAFAQILPQAKVLSRRDPPFCSCPCAERWLSRSQHSTLENLKSLPKSERPWLVCSFSLGLGLGVLDFHLTVSALGVKLTFGSSEVDLAA